MLVRRGLCPCAWPLVDHPEAKVEQLNPCNKVMLRKGAKGFVANIFFTEHVIRGCCEER